ncbi:SH3 domain-containing protein [Devosia sp. ZB163]|uniref:SH3 domain-containing protein n=1 Tax=Devosia sp. ZB163 TaxID=3025938 RepID=UPI002360CF5C|nr:SH3 domain-containing protein [Devosia sp. ZB163]MDC9825598.1 SH3 domain-containing protein [Devosia sp. ZB163]
MTRIIKTALLATAVVLATAGASMAATWAYADRDAPVRKNHAPNSQIINGVEEGQKVRIIGEWKNWYKVQLPGPDGWVRANAIDFDYYDDDYPTPSYPAYPVKPGFGTSFCVDGKNAQFCMGSQF